MCWVLNFKTFPSTDKSKINPGASVNGSLMEIKSDTVVKFKAPTGPTDEGLIKQISIGDSIGSVRAPQDTRPSGKETCTSFAGFSVLN